MSDLNITDEADTLGPIAALDEGLSQQLRRLHHPTDDLLRLPVA